MRGAASHSLGGLDGQAVNIDYLRTRRLLASCEVFARCIFCRHNSPWWPGELREESEAGGRVCSGAGGIQPPLVGLSSAVIA